MTNKYKILGYWEVYKCGCCSETTSFKKDLLGYCKHHGLDRSSVICSYQCSFESYTKKKRKNYDTKYDIINRNSIDHINC